MTQRHKLQIKIGFEVEGKSISKGELKRYLAPITFDEIIHKLPIDGLASIRENILQISVDVEIIRGAEKPAIRINQGDILFWPANNSIIIALQSGPALPQSVKIGIIDEGLSQLSRIDQGARIRIKPLE